jgi:hypothetical protein
MLLLGFPDPTRLQIALTVQYRTNRFGSRSLCPIRGAIRIQTMDAGDNLIGDRVCE